MRSTRPTLIRPLIVGALISTLVLSSCGGDDLTSGGDVPATDSASDDSSSDTVDPSDMQAAGDMLGLSARCTQIYTSMINALGSIGSTDDSVKQTFADLGEEFASIRDEVPDDLKDDIDILARDYSKYGELIDKYADDPSALSNPDVVQEFDDLMSSQEFNDANTNFTNWLDAECAIGS